jgi:hypothetical protein
MQSPTVLSFDIIVAERSKRLSHPMDLVFDDMYAKFALLQVENNCALIKADLLAACTALKVVGAVLVPLFFEFSIVIKNSQEQKGKKVWAAVIQ